MLYVTVAAVWSGLARGEPVFDRAKASSYVIPTRTPDWSCKALKIDPRGTRAQSKKKQTL